MILSAIIPAHNPDAGRLRRTLDGLRAQTLAPGSWEVILVDNASATPLEIPASGHGAALNARVVREPQLGLTAARHRGLAEARAPLVVFVDDDNVLAPDYLATVGRVFGDHPRLGAAGGRCVPEFESEPAPWVREFFPLLALRDLGNSPVFTEALRPAGAARKHYPVTAPIGAGMALRHSAVQTWLDARPAAALPDRRGAVLSSAGDNDIVFSLLEHGWHVAYLPELRLTHLIPAGRLAPAYLARLNRGIQHSWMQVLTAHDANPWPPIAPWTVPLRQAKAWFTHRAWAGPAARIRWQGACGHFEGRAAKPAG